MNREVIDPFDRDFIVRAEFANSGAEQSQTIEAETWLPAGWHGRQWRIAALYMQGTAGTEQEATETTVTDGGAGILVDTIRLYANSSGWLRCRSLWLPTTWQGQLVVTCDPVSLIGDYYVSVLLDWRFPPKPCGCQKKTPTCSCQGG